MGQIAFSDYIASRPTATTPVGVLDRIMILQGGVVKLVASDNTGGAIVPSVLIDATLVPITSLPAGGEIVYVKSDTSAIAANFAVSVVGQIMCQELINGIEVQGATIRVKLIGNKWYNIS